MGQADQVVTVRVTVRVTVEVTLKLGVDGL